MSDQKSDDDQVAQRRDAILLRLLKMPPKTHAELADELRRARAEKPTKARGKRANAGKPAGAA